jgi:hypothetical protein
MALVETLGQRGDLYITKLSSVTGIVMVTKRM